MRDSIPERMLPTAQPRLWPTNPIRFASTFGSIPDQVEAATEVDHVVGVPFDCRRS